ncbi:hypothetical protein GCM10027403_14460 [Arthrobacter tecti]
MNELLPALVGLAGVVVGGTIQVIFAGRQARDQHAREIRREVAEFSAAVSNYLNALDSATEYQSREHSDGPSKERVKEAQAEIAEMRKEALIRGNEARNCWGLACRGSNFECGARVA